MSLPRSVACVLTGSVESVVAALLLKKKGFRVTGTFIHNTLLPKQLNETLKEYAARAAVCLNISFREIHIPIENWNELKQSAVEDYKQGRTPDLAFKYTNDIVCGLALKHARQQFGVNSFATEHFARTSRPLHRTQVYSTTERAKLFRGVDQLYDDSRLFAGLAQSNLQHLVLPLGEINKEIVPKIAETAGLQSLVVREGLDHNEVQEIARQAVLKEMPPVPGKFLNVETFKEEHTCDNVYELKPGDIVKIHEQEFVVVEKDINNSHIYIAEFREHPALSCETFFTGLAHWQTEVPYDFYEKQMMNAEFRTGHHQGIMKGTMTVGATNEYCGNDHIIVSSSSPVKNIVPGYYAAFYRGEEVLGCGKIIKRGPSLYAMNYKLYKQKSHPQAADSTFKTFLRKLKGS